jgi:hypothetical protein
VQIEFLDERRYRCIVFEQNFRNGHILNPYHRSIFGVGYIGNGPHISKKSGNIKYPEYQAWYNMIMRCYDARYQTTHTAYIGCSVDSEWHNYQNFAEWWKQHWYQIPGERMDFDKDILYKNNRIYGPEKCCIIPHRINLLLVNRKRDRGETPVGVQRSGSSFVATCGIETGIVENLGSFSTVEDAFNAYKIRKEQNIKDVANRYKAYLPERVYNALMNRIIEITD